MSDDRPAINAASALAVADPARTRAEQARKDPPAEPVGECVVCRGQLAQEQGPRGYASWFSSPGWYCVRCGLRYHHLPSRPPSLADDDAMH